MKRLVYVLALALAWSACNAALAQTTAKRHMIAAAEPYAAEAGLDMLRAGGSAVDAAIAAQLVLTLVEPQSSGIGGGAYMMVAGADGKIDAYDGRETAPASARPTMFLDAKGNPRAHGDAIPGGLSVGVPGDVALLAKAHAAHGRLPWARLFEPAIKLAEQGFKVPARMAADVAQFGAMPDIRAAYYHADGTPLVSGEIWRNPAYAKTLRDIAAHGADAFYKGEIADEIIDKVKNAFTAPATITREDFASYRVRERKPLCGLYRRYRVCSMPPSTSGGITMLQVLGMMRHFKADRLKPNTLSAVHLLSEAERLAYADRARWIGDPDFVAVPLPGLVDGNYLAKRASLINPTKDMGWAESGTPPSKRKLIDYAAPQPPMRHGTSHLDVVDDRGEVVSITMSVENVFGSTLMAGGFVLNNELTDFTFVPEINGKPVANAPGAHKRPMSAMTPTIIFAPDGKFFAAIGSPGGPRIISYVIEAVIGLIDDHLTMQQAVSLPHFVNTNGGTYVEKDTALETLVPRLSAMGHDVRAGVLESGLNGIRSVNGGYEGGSDPRREGVAMGD